jgi:ribonuclease BN (tRNA processing enzyme)
MRLTTLGGCGAWPAARQACSGYLLEHGGFVLLIDPGYATLPRLLEYVDATDVDAVLAYTGDRGPDAGVVELARDADVLLAEATYVDDAGESGGLLSSARDAARQAAEADAVRLVLTHLWPGTDPDDATRAAREHYAGPLDVARQGLVIEL